MKNIKNKILILLAVILFATILSILFRTAMAALWLFGYIGFLGFMLVLSIIVFYAINLFYDDWNDEDNKKKEKMKNHIAQQYFHGEISIEEYQEMMRLLK